jgi:cell division protein FtsL
VRLPIANHASTMQEVVMLVVVVLLRWFLSRHHVRNNEQALQEYQQPNKEHSRYLFRSNSISSNSRYQSLMCLP